MTRKQHKELQRVVDEFTRRQQARANQPKRPALDAQQSSRTVDMHLQHFTD
jgi:hypothetical protein